MGLLDCKVLHREHRSSDLEMIVLEELPDGWNLVQDKCKHCGYDTGYSYRYPRTREAWKEYESERERQRERETVKPIERVTAAWADYRGPCPDD